MQEIKYANKSPPLMSTTNSSETECKESFITFDKLYQCNIDENKPFYSLLQNRQHFPVRDKV